MKYQYSIVAQAGFPNAYAVTGVLDDDSTSSGDFAYMCGVMDRVKIG